MADIITILKKIFIQQFYALNAGFFLLIITLTFGFMSGVEHKALAQFFTASPALVLIPTAVWLIYLLKIINFNQSRLVLPENKFIQDFILLEKVTRLQTILIVIVSQFMPATAYAIFLVLTALKSQQWFIMSLICTAQVMLISAGTIVTERAMHKQIGNINVWKIKAWIDKRFTKPLFIIYVTWILRREPMLVVATKLFSGALLFAISQLYKTDIYDWRLLAMGSVIAVAGNYMTVSQLHQFENRHFQFLKNLPISTLSRIVTILSVIFILTLPEFAVIVKNFPNHLTWIEGITNVAFILAGMLYFYSLNYLSIPADNFTRWILGSVIGSVLLILFDIPLTLLTICLFATAYLIVYFKYYRLEVSSKLDD